jgi:hypothetical protein
MVPTFAGTCYLYLALKMEAEGFSGMLVSLYQTRGIISQKTLILEFTTFFILYSKDERNLMMITCFHRILGLL